MLLPWAQAAVAAVQAELAKVQSAARSDIRILQLELVRRRRRRLLLCQTHCCCCCGGGGLHLPPPQLG